MKKLVLCTIYVIVFILLLSACSGGGSSDPESSFTASGRITIGESDDGLEGVTIQVGDKIIATTDESGNWSASGLTGTLTVTPAIDGWVCTPESRLVRRSNKEANFTAVEEVPETYTASGQIIIEDTDDGLEGVSVQVGSEVTVTTDESGNWSASNLSGTLTITPALDGWVFTPESREVSSSSTEANFAAAEETPETYTASGQIIIGETDEGLQGVSVQVGSEATVTTDESGNWSASNLSGTLTITPALDDWVFTPESREVNSSSTEANFTAVEETPETYDISGRVTDFGRGLEGVSIQLSNGTEVITGPYGNWSVEGVSGRITVTPVKNDWEFEPESLTVNGPNDEVNFSVVDGENIVYTVSGYVTIGESEDGLQGVSIIMDDVSKTTTDENGYYSVEGLTGIETITPELEGWTFDPSSDAVAYYKNEINFTAEELVTFTASGQVTDSVTGEGLEGVNIQVGDNNVLTDTSGNWSVSGLNGNLMVTPSMEGWWFSPYSTNVYEENPTANFTGQTAADTPNAPTIIEGDGRLTVEWEPVLRGAYYYVYYATVDDSEEAVLAVGDITTTRYTITELENYTSYYIWVQASSLNSFFAPEGLSDLSPSVSGMPIEEDPANFAGGSGTVDDPYLIATPEQLDKVRDNLDKHFRQINDIDLSEYSNGEGWEPIGTWDSYSGPNFPFTGTYNGDNKTISGLTINRENSDHQALFAYTEGSSIENVILDNVSITTNETETAGLVGENKGDISNCTVSGTISGGSLTGGLIGKNDGNGVITSCSSVAIVSGGNEVGGLVGRNWSGNIETCQASGNITAEVAGGGLVGKNHSGGTIMNSEACGEVTTTEYGGCQGGGLVGSNGGRIENSFATGITNNGGRSGGLVGINEGSGIILASYSTGEVNGDWTGGLVGDNKGEVRECYSTGNVSGIGYRIGGLVGANSGEIYKSFARGNVTNGYYVGGLVGENTGRIENSYTTSEVYGTNMVGGLVGNNNSADSVIINCYATGPVSAIYDKTGGLIWQSHDNSTITNSYYDRELTGQNDTGKGEPRSTSEMTYPYEDVDTYLDWDFTGTWLEDSTGSNDGYPYLHWE